MKLTIIKLWQFCIMFLKSAVATSMAQEAAGVYLFLLQKPTETRWSSHIANGSKNAETKGEASYIFFKHLIHSKLDFCRLTNVWRKVSTDKMSLWSQSPLICGKILGALLKLTKNQETFSQQMEPINYPKQRSFSTFWI